MHSELIASTDLRRIDGWHFRNHLEQDIVDVDGMLRWNGEQRFRDFYVEHGILKYEDNRYRPCEQKPDPNCKVIDGKTYARENGVWFLVEYVQLDRSGQVVATFPIFCWPRYGDPDVHQRKVKTLSKREKKTLGIL